MCICIYEEIYYMGLTQAILEADKVCSQQAEDSREPMV